MIKNPTIPIFVFLLLHIRLIEKLDCNAVI